MVCVLKPDIIMVYVALLNNYYANTTAMDSFFFPAILADCHANLLQ